MIIFLGRASKGPSTKVFRVFVSSPDDADVERRRVESVVSRLNGDFAGVARLETIRYETRFYQAHQPPQEQIPPAAECHLVIGVLRWRLGTPMPPDFPDRMPDGRGLPSGTAYELLTSIARRQGGANLPDIYVFRFAGSAPNPPLGDPDYEKVKREWEALSAFLTSGSARRKVPSRPISTVIRTRTTLKRRSRRFCANGSRTRSRARARPAGRSRSMTRPSAASTLSARNTRRCSSAATARSRARSSCGAKRRSGARRFFLSSGPAAPASRPSPARARPEADHARRDRNGRWMARRRHAPGRRPGRTLCRLGRGSVLDVNALPREEEGRGPALPELADGDFQTPADLGAALRHADETAVRPIRNALRRVAEATRKREAYARALRCDLLLLVDQLDELDPAVDPSARETFLALLAALVATGHVWVAATLRDAFYPQVVASPALSGLKQRGASLDVAPPDPRSWPRSSAPPRGGRPRLDKDPASGETLDQRILREADEPDMLPLVQLALTRLFDLREAGDGRVVLR